MSYIEEFQSMLDTQQYTRFLRLWEEYCLADTVEGEELLVILKKIKGSTFAAPFGQYFESMLALWQQIQDEIVSNDVLRIIVDLQTSNVPLIADLSANFLTKKYSQHRHFNEFIRLVGLRYKQNFQGAISHFELLVHMEKGNFVFHTGGWGVGEIMDVSLVREHVLVEFEGISSPKDLSFENAFKMLLPLPKEHFLSRRFGNPDKLEKEGKEDPLFLVHLLLKDLGPKTAAEIKEELCDLVIPEKEWTKWWQLARAKIKKDTHIKSPESSKGSFELRLEEVSHETRLRSALEKVDNTQNLIQTIYQFTRDFPELNKNTPLKTHLKELLDEALKQKLATTKFELAQTIQLHFLLDDLFPEVYKEISAKQIETLQDVEGVIGQIDIIAFKKRALVLVREKRKDWHSIFLHLFFVITPSVLRDYIFKELSQEKSSLPLLKSKLKELLDKVTVYPEAFFWYFQKVTNGEEVPLNDKEHQRLFLECFFILLHYIEQDAEKKELLRKMHQFLTQKRYAVVREIIQDASKTYLQELLLLASKCYILSKQEYRILQSLAEVACPELTGGKKEESEKTVEIIWTTAEGYKKIQEKIQHIGTVETVDNAREIEAARALGDLRENSEYKFALERRSRLQSELKTLSHQLNAARIITKDDVATGEVSVGVTVHLLDAKGKKVAYTLLGPWDADPEQNILSVQSKLAQAMIGRKKGDTFEFQGDRYTVQEIKSYL